MTAMDPLLPPAQVTLSIRFDVFVEHTTAYYAKATGTCNVRAQTCACVSRIY